MPLETVSHNVLVPMCSVLDHYAYPHLWAHFFLVRTLVSMSEVVLFVEIRVREGRTDEFLQVIRENALRSRADEPGCRRFDVTVAEDDPHRVMLYEIYDDEAAYQAHRTMPHYHAFKARAPELIEKTVVQRFRLAG